MLVLVFLLYQVKALLALIQEFEGKERFGSTSSPYICASMSLVQVCRWRLSVEVNLADRD